MNLKPRRRLAAATALAAFVSLGACASQAEDPDPPAVTASPTPTPTLSAADKAKALCEAVVGLDAALLNLGPPEEMEVAGGGTSTSSPRPTSGSTSSGTGSTGSASSSASTEEEATSMPSPRFTAAAVSTATPDPTDEPTGAPAGPPRVDIAEVLTPAADALDDAPTIEAVASDVDKMVSMLREAISAKERDVIEGLEFAKAGAPVDKWMLSNCGYGELKAKALDHEYDGLPKTLKGGINALTLTNEGDEIHEMVLFRINDDVTQGMEALLELPEEQLFSKALPAGVIVVASGATGTSFYDLKPGRYGVVCFIPKDSLNGKFGDGPPHFTEGMVADLTVT